MTIKILTPNSCYCIIALMIPQISTKKEAHQFWAEMIQDFWAGCPKCGNKKIYCLKNMRKKCAKCRKTFNGRYGTMMGRTTISDLAWFRMVKEFCEDLPAYRAARVSNISYPSANRIYRIMRTAIVRRSHDVELARLAEKNGIPSQDFAFGLRERQNKPLLTTLNSMSGGQLLKQELHGVIIGKLYVAASAGEFPFLVSPISERNIRDRYQMNKDNEDIDLESKRVYEKLYDNNSLLGQFIDYALRSIIRNHRSEIGLLLKEAEFKYNNSIEQRFSTVSAYISS